jgi:hypothetical protein
LFRYDLEVAGNMPRVDWDSLKIVETHDIFIITTKRRYLFLVYEMRSHFFANANLGQRLCSKFIIFKFRIFSPSRCLSQDSQNQEKKVKHLEEL